jgi:hypothetical protein
VEVHVPPTVSALVPPLAMSMNESTIKDIPGITNARRPPLDMIDLTSVCLTTTASIKGAFTDLYVQLTIIIGDNRFRDSMEPCVFRKIWLFDCQMILAPSQIHR